MAQYLQRFSSRLRNAIFTKSSAGMAEVLRMPLATPLRRRAQIRFKHACPTERRKKKAAGFGVAAALEHNLDAYRYSKIS